MSANFSMSSRLKEVLHVAQLISVHHAPYVAKPKPKTTKAQPKEIWPNANITVSYVWRASQSLTQPKLLQYVHDSSQMMPLQTCSGGQRMPTLPNLPSAVRSPNSDKTLSCSNQDPDCPWIFRTTQQSKISVHASEVLVTISRFSSLAWAKLGYLGLGSEFIESALKSAT